MAKPKSINQKAKYRAHFIRFARYADRVQSVYDTLSMEIANAVVRTPYDGSEPFHFSDYPLTKKKIEDVQAAFVRDLRSVIYTGTSEEWKQSNLVQDLLADKVLKFYGVKKDKKKHRVYYQTNSDAQKAFQERKDNGMGLSERLWNQSKNYKEEMEFAISSSFENGTSAVKLSKRLSKYLVDFPSLKNDYKEKFGKAVTCNDCEYRSIRLARTEINMAYRTAEQERWKQFDFVLGYEVKLTQNGHHVSDMCDDLAGKYPKDFVFKGWHPNCMCYVVPILKTEDEFWEEREVKPIMDVPDGYKLWVRNNEDRIESASSLPYFLRDNNGWKDYLDLEYHRLDDGKFDKVYNDAERMLRRQKYEQMKILTPSGKIVATQQGNTGNVFFDDSVAKLAENNIVIHNHPSGNMFPKEDFRSVGSSFSSSDLKEAVRCNMRSFVAISKSYRYTIDRPSVGWEVSFEEVAKEYRKIYDEIKTEYDFSYHPVWMIIWQHLTVKRLSKKLGFVYKYQKI